MLAFAGCTVDNQILTMDAGIGGAPRVNPWPGTDWQRMWVAATRGTPWRCLALVPAGSGAPADFTLDVAMSLTRTGMMYTGTQIHVADATQLSPSDANEFARQIREIIASGPVIVALGPASGSAVTVPLAQSADTALLCVLLHRMRMNEAKQVVRDIGRTHFRGALTFE